MPPAYMGARMRPADPSTSLDRLCFWISRDLGGRRILGRIDLRGGGRTVRYGENVPGLRPGDKVMARYEMRDW